MIKHFLVGLITFFTLANLAIAHLPDLNGRWQKKCSEDNDENYFTAELAIEDSRWQIIYTAYEDSACRSPYLHFTRFFTASIDGFELDLKMAQASYTPLTSETTEALNSIAWCGKTDWTSKHALDVTGLVCGDYNVAKKGQITYSILKFAQNNTQIYLGKNHLENDGQSPQKRHRELENQAYEKIP